MCTVLLYQGDIFFTVSTVLLYLGYKNPDNVYDTLVAERYRFFTICTDNFVWKKSQCVQYSCVSGRYFFNNVYSTLVSVRKKSQCVQYACIREILFSQCVQYACIREINFFTMCTVLIKYVYSVYREFKCTFLIFIHCSNHTYPRNRNSTEKYLIGIILC